MKNIFTLLFILLPFLVFSQVQMIGHNETKPISALNQKKWQDDGIFGGFAPKDEILNKRTQNTKHFQKDNGDIVAQIGGNYHYQDENSQWQDIDFTITKTNVDGFAYSNTTNSIKTYFPETAGDKGISISDKSLDITIWKNPELLILDNDKNIIQRESSLNNAAQVNNNIAKYQSFNGVVDEIKIIDNGIENNIILNNFQNQWTNLSGAKTISFKQFVELPRDVKVLNSNGEIVKSDFTDQLIGLQFADGQILFLNPLVVFDAQSNKEDAQLFYGLEEGKIPADIKAKANSFYKGSYTIKFVNNGIEIYSDVDLAWLQQAQYPVTIDPTWTVGSTASGDFRGPLTHWYGYQRHASLYLQSEISGYGNITQIEYYKTNTAAARTKPTKVYMRTIAGTTITSTAAWNSTTYTGGLTALYNANTTQDATAGWKGIPVTYNYASGNLLVMLYDAYGGSGGSQYMAQASATNLQTYSRGDGTDPGDASTMAVGAERTTIRITYGAPPAYQATFTSMNTGSATWCAGETRNVTVTVTNSGTSTWTNSPDINIGCKWNADADFFVRCDANNLEPGASHTYTLTMTAPSTTGSNNLSFNVVYEGCFWFNYASGTYCGVTLGNTPNYISPAITISNCEMKVPASGNNSYTTCSGHIYDHGGSGSGYNASVNGYTVIYPGNSSQAVQLTGTYDTESCCDHIYIYDGVGTGGTLLGQFQGTGGSSIGTITSSGANVPLTILFTSDGSVQYSGFDFTIACVAATLPGENCTNAQNLASLSSPFSGTTVGYADDISICRTGSPDRIFYISVPNGNTIDIWESTNSYDEYEYMGYGGSCPGTTTINCWDNDGLAHNTWTNTTGSTQTVWYVQDAWSGSGTFTLNWTLTAPPVLPCGNTNLGIITPGACSMQNANYTSGTIPYWSFSASAGTTYNFSLGGQNTEDSYLHLYNSSMTEVLSNDDSGPFQSGSPSSLSYTCTTSGTYYVTACHYTCTAFSNSSYMTLVSHLILSDKFTDIY